MVHRLSSSAAAEGKVVTNSIEDMVDVNSVSYIQDIIWNTYISQPKE